MSDGTDYKCGYCKQDVDRDVGELEFDRQFETYVCPCCSRHFRSSLIDAFDDNFEDKDTVYLLNNIPYHEVTRMKVRMKRQNLNSNGGNNESHNG